MKNIIWIGLLSLVLGASAFSQSLDATTQAYSKATYLDATATDTTRYMPFEFREGLATHIVLTGVATDSVNVIVSYQLKNSITGLTGAMTLADTLTGTNNTSNVGLLASLAIATTAGYNQIRYEHNYITGNGTTAGRVYKLYHTLIK